jgi:hypothetical protein
MVSLTRNSGMDKAKETLRDVLSYTDEVIRDERLRADIRAAVGHGSKAGDRVKKDVNAGAITTRLAADKKLLKDLRRMLDDLDSASERIRRKKSHRARNALLIVASASAGAALVVIPSVRQWLSRQRTSEFTSATPGDATA